MQQHGGGADKSDSTTSATSNTKSTAGQSASYSSTASTATASTSKPTTQTPSAPVIDPTEIPADPKAPVDTAVKGKAPTVAPASDLARMIVQATIRASKGAATTPSTGGYLKTPAKPSDNPGTGTASDNDPSDSLPDSTDLSSMLARIALLTSHAQQFTSPKTTSTPTDTTSSGTDATAGDDLGKSHSPLITDLSSMIVQASLLASNAHQTAATAAATATATASSTTTTITVAVGKDIPLLGLTKGVAATPAKEKKSAAPNVEGSFLQLGASSTTIDASTKDLLGTSLTTVSQLSSLQQVTPTTGSKNSSYNDPLNATSSVAGTANVEKGKAMNADLNIPQLVALSGLGTPATALQQTPADLHIQLSSNNDFQDALKQVMHVAELTQTSESRTPMRVAIEIQTPPGAIVNVYVSRQNDQWRAQLSTNDPQALTWVQDKMNSLRSGDVGVEVKWLPPQMETSSGGSNNSNLGWDRGGQNQSNYQQPDERSQSQRQKRAGIEPELATVGATQFMNTLTSVAGVA